MDSTMHPTEELRLSEKPATPRALAEAVVTILDRKKARDLKLLHVEKKTVIADYLFWRPVHPAPRSAHLRTRWSTSYRLWD